MKAQARDTVRGSGRQGCGSRTQNWRSARRIRRPNFGGALFSGAYNRLHVSAPLSRRDVPRVGRARSRVRGSFFCRRDDHAHLLPSHLSRACAAARSRRFYDAAGGAARRLPALRLRPLDHGQPPPRLVTELLAAVEAEPGSRLRDVDPRSRASIPDRTAAIQALLRHELSGVSSRPPRRPRADRHSTRKEDARPSTRSGLRIRQRLPGGVRAPHRNSAEPRPERAMPVRAMVRNAARIDARAGR